MTPGDRAQREVDEPTNKAIYENLKYGHKSRCTFCQSIIVQKKKSALSPLDDGLWAGKGKQGQGAGAMGRRALRGLPRWAGLPRGAGGGRRSGRRWCQPLVAGCLPASSYSAVSHWLGRAGQPLLSADHPLQRPGLLGLALTALDSLLFLLSL